MPCEGWVLDKIGSHIIFDLGDDVSSIILSQKRNLMSMQKKSKDITAGKFLKLIGKPLRQEADIRAS